MIFVTVGTHEQPFNRLIQKVDGRRSLSPCTAEKTAVFYKVELPAVTAERVLGMIALRETTRKLLDCQLHDGSDAEVQLLQNELKQQYTAFKAQYP